MTAAVDDRRRALAAGEVPSVSTPPHPVEEAVARVKSLAVALRDQRFNHMPLVSPKHYPDLAADLDALLSALERQREALRKAAVEVETAERILRTTPEDWADFDGTSKKLGSNATHVLNRIKGRIEGATLCCADARSALGGQHG